MCREAPERCACAPRAALRSKHYQLAPRRDGDLPTWLQGTHIRIGRYALDVDENRRDVSGEPDRVGHRESSTHREPDASTVIRDDGSVPLHALDTEQPISESVLTQVFFVEGAEREPFPVDAQHAIGGHDPQRSRAILCETENRAAQQWEMLKHRLDAAAAEQGQTCGRSNPQVVGRVLE